MMTPQRWQQVKQIFQSALEQPPGERSGYLHSACGEDDALRDEVQSLIRSHEGDPSFIDEPAEQSVAVAASEHFATGIKGQRIGPYQLTDIIAAGGMGAVYAAVRADDAYQKRVAIKLIRPGANIHDPKKRREILRRFRTERQALALLDHPNLAKLLDGGTTDDGLPYLVMDYIDGQPVDVHCDAQKLSITDRLRLFQHICDAVSYAHRNLVVHRDLKPNNILVTPDGHPKLLDFGIAKILGADDTDDSTNRTLTGVQPMTPRYASPEQITGGAITTATDVYSLGVVLYELLTGHRPYGLDTVTDRDLAAVICERNPIEPSLVVTRTETILDAEGAARRSITPDDVSRCRAGHPDKLRRELAGDLDNIVLKALRKEPERRYASVEQFSDDIDRYLTGLPVSARKDTFTYRTAKFIRRNKLGVTATATIVIAFVLGIVGTASQARVAAHERDVANTNMVRAQDAEQQAAAEAEMANRVADYLVNLFDIPDPLRLGEPDAARGVQMTAGEMLRLGAERASAEFNDRPDIHAALLNAIGRVYRNLGACDDAIRVLSAALDAERRSASPDPSREADILFHLGAVHLDQGKPELAEPPLLESLAILEHLPESDAAALARGYAIRGDLRFARGDYEAAESDCRDAIDVLDETGEPDHPDAAHYRGRLARIVAERGRYDEALELARAAVEQLRRIHGDRHPNVADAMGELGRLLMSPGGDYDAARQLLHDAIDIHRDLLGPDHPAVATGLNKLAVWLIEQGHYADAIELLNEALAILNRAHEPDHPSILDCLNNLGYASKRVGNLAAAEQAYQNALDLRHETLGNDHPDVAESLNNVAAMRYIAGDYAAAARMIREAFDIRRNRLGDSHPDTIDTGYNLASVLVAAEEYDAAENVFVDLLRTVRLAYGDTHARVTSVMSKLAVVRRYRGDYEGAERAQREAIGLIRQQLPLGGKVLAHALFELARVLKLAGKPVDAIEAVNESVERWRELIPVDNEGLARALLLQAQILIDTNRAADAEPPAREAIGLFRTTLPEDHPLVIESQEALDASAGDTAAH
ncbi:MAG: serine/threonine protein kinase [Phycisphaerales bacterium]|nr:serine/threonine protein kinase [Phycisphaerales bacterium]